MVRVTKMEAARRQMATAITLWFNNGDEVSIYALSHAAYEVIHNLTRPNRQHRLIFDSALIKEGFRKEFNTLLRNPANFFKHASRNQQEEPDIEFAPVVSEMFILFAILGVELEGLEKSDEEAVFLIWLLLHRPGILTKKGLEVFSNSLPVHYLAEMRAIKRSEFFEALMLLRRQHRAATA